MDELTARQGFPNAPEAVPRARHYVLRVLRDVPAEVAERVGLMVSELATNCVRHTASDFTVELEQTPTRISVRVTDGASGTPRVKSPGPAEPSGRGLRIVEQLADAFGVDYEADDRAVGKTVWFIVKLQPPGAAGTGRSPL